MFIDPILIPDCSHLQTLLILLPFTLRSRAWLHHNIPQDYCPYTEGCTPMIRASWAVAGTFTPEVGWCDEVVVGW